MQRHCFPHCNWTELNFHTIRIICVFYYFPFLLYCPFCIWNKPLYIHFFLSLISPCFQLFKSHLTAHPSFIYHMVVKLVNYIRSAFPNYRSLWLATTSEHIMLMSGFAKHIYCWLAPGRQENIDNLEKPNECISRVCPPWSITFSQILF